MYKLLLLLNCVTLLLLTACTEEVTQLANPDIAKIKAFYARAYPADAPLGDNYKIIGWVQVKNVPFFFIAFTEYSRAISSEPDYSYDSILIFDKNLILVAGYSGSSADVYKVVGKSKIQFLYKGNTKNESVNFSSGLPLYYDDIGGNHYLWTAYGHFKDDTNKESLDNNEAPIKPIPFDKNIIKQFANYKEMVKEYNLEIKLSANIDIQNSLTLILTGKYQNKVILKYIKSGDNIDYQFQYLAFYSNVKINGMKVIGKSKEDIINFFGKPNHLYSVIAPIESHGKPQTNDYYLTYGGDAANDYVFMDFQIVDGKVRRCTLGQLPH